MTELLSFAAFFIAFGTVFLVNDAMRKTERKHDAAVKQFFDKLSKELSENSMAVKEMRGTVEEINAAYQSNSEDVIQLKIRLNDLDKRLQQTQEELTEQLSKNRKSSRRSA